MPPASRPRVERANVLGVGVSAITIAQALDAIESWIVARDPHYVCVTGVHGVMESQRDERTRAIHNAAGLVTPDGMPLVWLSRLLGFPHVERVYGPDLLLTFCRRSEARGFRHFFYGGGPGVAERLAARLQSAFPALRIAGHYTPPFRDLTPAEDAEVVQRIRDAGPDVLWIGLSTPRQERWMDEHLRRLGAPVIVGIGAAFDFVSGAKRQAPRWIQRSGFEWLFRLLQEPRRLWRRYCVNNPLFVMRVAGQLVGLRRYELALDRVELPVTAPLPLEPVDVVSRPTHGAAPGPRSWEHPVAIVGAGIAGLVAARELRRNAVPVAVYEAGPRVAGLATTFRDLDGFVYDFGAHFITNRLAAEIGVAEACRDVRRYGETVVLQGRNYSYPFGLARSPRLLAGAVSQALKRNGRPPESAADWFRTTYGDALARRVAIPLIEKWSGVPADALAASVGEKMPGGVAHTLFLKVASRVTGRAIASGYCREQPESVRVWHVYPVEGLSVLCAELLEELGEVVRLSSPVEAIRVADGRAVGVRVGGKDVEAATVMSTAPVHVLARLVEGTRALEPLTRFRYRPMVFVNLRFEGRGLLPDVMTWTPEPEFPFFRLTETPVSIPWLAPEGKTLITADLGCEVGDEIWSADDADLGELCLGPLERVVPGARRRYLGCRVLRTPIAYPVFLREYEAERRALEESTGVPGLYSIGRNGEFAHILMEDVYWRTRRRVQQFLDESSAPGPTPTLT